MEENKVELLDENGNPVEMIIDEEFEFEDTTYVILIENEESDDAYLCKLEEDENGELFIAEVEDEDEFNRVSDYYDNLDIDDEE